MLPCYPDDSSSIRRRPADLYGGDRQICIFLYTLISLLPLTWPSWLRRGRKPWEKLCILIWRPFLHMRKLKQFIWTLLQHVGGKGLIFSRLGAESCRLPPQDFQYCSYPWRRGSMPYFCKNYMWLLELSGPKLFCTDRFYCYLRLPESTFSFFFLR